ncbi:hypothetical protein CDAR_256181 [Caerostris darwini]|uniref:Uncharacterized protein n=1 Tax=Caerostris darwini TaxID=1538125 RepID=A0AAV4QXC8_9ARAC|nr:hypothetical protein CDAR_256181 [Caerostris darwini]
MTLILRKVRLIQKYVLLGNATDRRALALYRISKTISEMLLFRTCSESSPEEELQKFDPDPEHPKNNRSVNGIFQDRITIMWIVQKKRK